MLTKHPDGRWRSEFILAALDWLVDEMKAGRRPTTASVAAHFAISLTEANELHDHLREIGEI